MHLNVQKFSHIRLSDYLPCEILETVSSFEYYGRQWLGEILEFTHVLQPQNSPALTKCIAVHIAISRFRGVYERLLADISIPLKSGMDLPEANSLLKANPINYTHRTNGTEYEYLFDDFYLSCFFGEESGLSYVVVLTDKEAIENLNLKPRVHDGP